MNNQLKVLMLGWEYPPLITGGLGKATLGLVESLSRLAQVTLILPKIEAQKARDNQIASDQFAKNLDIIGLNKINDADLPPDTKQVEKIKQVEEVVEEVYYVKADFYPYPDTDVYFREVKPVTQIKEIVELMSEPDVYGPRVMEKIATYTQTVCEIADLHTFDIIHAHDWMTFQAGVKIKEKTGKPLVVHIHSLETDRMGIGARTPAYFIEQEAMLKANRVITVSNYTANQVVKHYNIPKDKIIPVHNSSENMEPFKYEKAKDEKIVVFFGRLTQQKGTEFMLETAARVIAKYPKVKFVISGHGNQLTQMTTKVKEWKLSQHFIFTGHLDKKQLRYILAMSDIYLMTSVSEPFGLATLEAAQFDIPVVISQQSGVAEVMPHALKANYWEVDKFANYVFALLSYEGLRKEIIEKNKKHRKQDDWLRAACEVLSLYYTIV